MKVEKLLPEVYYKESRDFAYAGRLIEFALNYMKSAADCIDNNLKSEYENSNLIDLWIDTLGFDSKHVYTNRDLVILASAFYELLQNKGNIRSIELAIRLILNAQGIRIDLTDNELCVFDTKRMELQINVPDNVTDLILIEDIFNYILPVGVVYKFIRVSGNNAKHLTKVNLNTKSSSIVSAIVDTDGNITGGIFDTDLGIVESEGLGTGSGAHGSKGEAPGSIYSGLVVTELPKSDSN